MRLDRPDYARHHVMPTEQALDFGREARPDTNAEFSQQLPVKTGVQSQTLRDGENHLPVRDGKTDLFGHVEDG